MTFLPLQQIYISKSPQLKNSPMGQSQFAEKKTLLKNKFKMVTSKDKKSPWRDEEHTLKRETRLT
jgi:hypothetical protein